MGLFAAIFLGFFIISELKSHNYFIPITYSILLGIILVVTWGIAFFGKPLHIQIEEAQDFIYHLNPLYELVEKEALEYYFFLVGIVIGIFGVSVIIINKVVKYRRNRKKKYW